MYNIYDINFDADGRPGEYVFGDDIYIPDEYIDELWKRDSDIPEYWVSTHGRIWSDISNSFISGSPIGRCGHIDVSLQIGGRRVHKYLHRMVAEAFIPNPHNYPIVRHLDDDPLNNCVENLAWGTQVDNMRDAILNERFRYFTDMDRENAMRKRRVPVKAINIRTGRERVFRSQGDAARHLKILQSSISGVLLGKRSNVNGYYFCHPDKKQNDMQNYKHVRHRALIKASNIRTEEEFIFEGQTEAANALGISIASISNVLNKKQASSKDFYFEYVDEEDLL